MFIQVRLLKGFSKPLLYKLPDDWPQTDLVGHIVHVPIQKRQEHAIVIGQYQCKPADSNFEIRQALSVEPFPNDAHYRSFIKKLSSYHQIEPLHFFKRIRGFLEQEQKAIREKNQKNDLVNLQPREITLTKEQQVVTDFVV